MKLYKQLPSYVATFRAQQGLTRKELSKKMIAASGQDWRDDLLKVEAYENKIYRWETGESFPKLEDVYLLSVLADLSMEELMYKIID